MKSTNIAQLINSSIVKTQGNIVSDMDGEMVMLSIQSGKYYNLGTVGGRIMELMGSPTTVSEIVDILIAEYDVSRQECEEQVTSFLEHLLEEGIIQAV